MFVVNILNSRFHHKCGEGFHSVRGLIDPENHRVFAPGLLELWIYGMASVQTGGGTLPCSGAVESYRCPEGQLSPCARSLLPGYSWNPSQSAIRQWSRVSTPCRVVSTRGVTAFVPGLLEM